MSEATLVEEPKVSEQLAVVVRDSGLELESAQGVLNVFAPLLQQAEDWRQKVALIHVTDVSQTREMKLARESRLALREIRLNADKARKKLKEDSLRRGRAIDGAYNIVAFIVEPLEKSLEEQEKFVERREAARKAELSAFRSADLLKFGANPTLYKLDEMPDEVYAQLLSDTKAHHALKLEEENRIARERLERERIAREEQARVWAENERLKQEAAAREEAARQERLKQQALREIERQKQAAAEEAARKEREELQRKVDAAQKAEREAKAAALEEQRKRDAEAQEKARQAKAAAEEAARKEREAAAAPDREKLRQLARQIRALVVPAVQAPGISAAIAGSRDDFASYVENIL